MVDKHKGLDRDELSIEISGAVDNAHITDTFNIKGRLMRVVDTQPYPKGEHPLEMMSKPTAPYPVKLHGLLMELCHEALLSARLDERLRTFFTLQSLKNEICSQLIKIAPENQARYVTSLKNAISYIIDSVISRGINRSITLEIPNV